MNNNINKGESMNALNLMNLITMCSLVCSWHGLSASETVSISNNWREQDTCLVMQDITTGDDLHLATTYESPNRFFYDGGDWDWTRQQLAYAGPEWDRTQ